MDEPLTSAVANTWGLVDQYGPWALGWVGFSLSSLALFFALRSARKERTEANERIDRILSAAESERDRNAQERAELTTSLNTLIHELSGMREVVRMVGMARAGGQ